MFATFVLNMLIFSFEVINTHFHSTENWLTIRKLRKQCNFFPTILTTTCFYLQLMAAKYIYTKTLISCWNDVSSTETIKWSHSFGLTQQIAIASVRSSSEIKIELFQLIFTQIKRANTADAENEKRIGFGAYLEQVYSIQHPVTEISMKR